jgi:hypothetical protein
MPHHEAGEGAAAGYSVQDDAVVDWAVGEVLEPYRRELLERRQRDADIKRRYGIRSLEQRLFESVAKLSDYYARPAQGREVPEVTVQNEERTKEQLEERKRHLEIAIRRETTLSPTAPRVVGVARILPAPVDGDDMQGDPETEAVAMGVAIAYEQEHERRPEDVSAAKVGYDIRSTEAEPGRRDGDGAVRYIEVKGRAQTGPIALTPNEWLMAQRLGADYWLYVVEECRAEPRLFTIQNPAAVLQPEERVEVVRYVVRRWKDAAQDQGTGSGGCP